MNRVITYILGLAACIGAGVQPVFAQVNLKAGYSIGLVSDKGLNSVIDQFNSTQTYTKGFNHLSWVHGVEVGLRFKSDIHAFELNYQGGYQRIKAKGDANGGTEPYTDKLRISVNSAGLGYNVTGEVFGMGAEAQYQWYQTRVELTQEAREFNHVQNMWALKVYCMFTLHGQNSIDAQLQPYYILPFDHYDLEPLSQFLNNEPGPAGERWTRIGISMLFYNGRK